MLMGACRSQFCSSVSFRKPGLTMAKEHCGKKKGEGKNEQFHDNKILVEIDIVKICDRSFHKNIS